MTDLFDPQRVLTHCGRMLRAYRKAHGLTQAALATQLGLADGRPISRFERGEHWLHEPLVSHLRFLLGIPAAQFYPQLTSADEEVICALLPAAAPPLKHAVRLVLEQCATGAPPLPYDTASPCADRTAYHNTAR